MLFRMFALHHFIHKKMEEKTDQEVHGNSDVGFLYPSCV